MKILISGSNGFVGSNFLKKLLSKNDIKEHEIHSIYYNPDGKMYSEFRDNEKKYFMDLSNESDVEKLFDEVKPDVFVHIAWYVNHLDFKNSLKNFDHIKITYNLLKNFTKNKGKRFIFTGTCFENEENFSSIYSKSKDISSFLVRDFAKTFGFHYHILRPSFLYGIGEPSTKLVPNIISKMLKNENIECNVPNNCLNFINVNDVSSAAIKAIFSERLPINEINVFDKKNYSIKEFILYCAEKLNYDKSKLSFIENQKYEMKMSKDMELIGCNIEKDFFEYIDEIINFMKSKNE